MPAAEQLRVGGLLPFTTIDYPGELAAVVFCQGCPWRCRYCHNPELLGTKGRDEIPWPDVVALLERRRGLLDAVVFSGGEPTHQHAIHAAVAESKAMGYKVGLHTAGVYPRELEALLSSVDWVGLDIKALPDAYSRITTVEGSGTPAWESARLVIESGISHEMRITVHPRLLSRDHVAEIMARLHEMGTHNVVEQPCLTELARDPELRTADAEAVCISYPSRLPRRRQSTPFP
ncbi:MAG: anaerobic ribonucleoside-triphosphate reductase activating protein [Candidatus Hydrogenedentota bacterium]